MSSSENIHPVLELENAFYEAFSPVLENDNDRNVVDDQRFVSQTLSLCLD